MDSRSKQSIQVRYKDTSSLPYLSGAPNLFSKDPHSSSSHQLPKQTGRGAQREKDVSGILSAHRLHCSSLNSPFREATFPDQSGREVQLPSAKIITLIIAKLVPMLCEL